MGIMPSKPAALMLGREIEPLGSPRGAPLPWYLAKTPATLRAGATSLSPTSCAARLLRAMRGGVAARAPSLSSSAFPAADSPAASCGRELCRPARKPRKIEQRMKLLVKDDELGLPPAFAFHNLVIARCFDPQPFLEEFYHLFRELDVPPFQHG
jgi:hypothetical protein